MKEQIKPIEEIEGACQLYVASSNHSCDSTIVKPKQAGTCGWSIRNEHTSKSLICTKIKYYRTYSIYSLSRLYAILLSITKKTARKWKFGIVDDTCVLPTSASLFWFYYRVVELELVEQGCNYKTNI